MIISIDIDGVLVDRENYQLEKALEYAKANGLNDKVIDQNGYNVHQIFGWSKEDFLNFWNKYLWHYATLPPIKDVKTILEKLKKDGHKIIINTSRWLSEQENEIGKQMREAVKSWFEKYGLPYDELLFAKGDKLSIINNFKADIHIEDNPIEAQPIAEQIPVIIYNANYNKNYSGTNIYHANSWNEIYNLVTTLSNEKSKN